MGVITATFRQVEPSHKKVDRKGSSGLGFVSKVKVTKKPVDQPSVGNSTGRVVAKCGKLNQNKKLYEFGKVSVRCQTALFINMLKAQHDGVDFDAEQEVPEPVKKEDDGAPVVKDEAGSSGKKRAVIEIDLTSLDSDSDNEASSSSSSSAGAEANKRVKPSEIDLDFTN